MHSKERSARRTRIATFAVAFALGMALVSWSSAAGAWQQEAADDDNETFLTRHGVFVFDCRESGFDPGKVTTDPGKSTIFIHNASATSNQYYTITRKRSGKKKILFEGQTIPGQSIMGNTKFRSGDVYILKEINLGVQAKIKVR